MASHATCWILSDGTRGMEVQSEAMAQALGFSFEIKRYRPLPLLRAWPRLALSGWLPPHDGGDSLAAPWPQVAIACGRRNAGALLWLKQASRGQVFSIQIQNPKSANKHFDLLITPAHDRVTGGNVLTSTGSLNAINETVLAAAAEAFAAELAPLPKPRVAVLVGGSNRRYKLTAADIAGFANNLADFAVTHGAGLMVSTSRRTPEHGIAALQQCLEDVPHLLWAGQGENPYFAYLAAADAIIVTSDSGNMMSEACATGKPVYIAEIKPEQGRLKLFQEQLIAAGMARPFDGELETWHYPPLREAERIAAQMRRRS